MKKILIFSLIIGFTMSITVGCNAEKHESSQRRGLMMPRKSEIPRNMKHYKERERMYNSKTKH